MFAVQAAGIPMLADEPKRQAQLGEHPRCDGGSCTD